MSWSINVIGSKPAVAAAIEKEQHLPEPLKAMVRLICATPSVYTNAVQVETVGHFDSQTGGNVYTFRVTPLTLAPEPPSPTPTTTATP